MKRKKRKYTAKIISFDTRIQIMTGLVVILAIVFSLLVARNILQPEAPKAVTKLDTLQQLKRPQISQEILQKYEQKHEILYKKELEKEQEEVDVLKPSVYRVSHKDSLYKIAKKVYGKASYWPLIYKYNNLKDPDHIVVGQALVIPAKHTAKSDLVDSYILALQVYSCKEDKKHYLYQSLQSLDKNLAKEYLVKTKTSKHHLIQACL